MKEVGKWTTKIDVDPTSKDSGEVSLEFRRTRSWSTAVRFIGAGSLVATGVALAAGWLLPVVQKRSRKSDVGALVAKQRARVEAVLREPGGIALVAREELREAWVKCLNQMSLQADADELDRRARVCVAAVGALEVLLAQGARLSNQHSNSRLAASIVSAAMRTPDLRSLTDPEIYAYATVSVRWVDLVEDIAETLSRTADDHEQLQDLMLKALDTGALLPETALWTLRSRLAQLQQHVRADFGELDELDLDQLAVARFSGTAARAATVGRAQPIPVEIQLAKALQAGRRDHQIVVGIEVLVAVLALGIAIVIGLTTQYFASDVWGTTADKWKAFGWAFTASGAVQVSKFVVAGSPMVSTKAT